MMTKYSKQFKIEAVKKVLLRGQDRSISSVARSLGIKISTIHGWIKAMKTKDLTEDTPTSGGTIQKIPYRWSTKERFDSIIESSKLSQEELSEYCRKKGVFPHHLEKWKVEFVESFGNGQFNNSETKKLKNEIKNLSFELKRKEKALAEAAALLVLKKKASDLWKLAEDA
jgi:transposase-like protein